VASLGLRRLNSTVERPDTPSIRGMVNKIHHLVRVEEIPAADGSLGELGRTTFDEARSDA
jgi:hypothetical protein